MFLSDYLTNFHTRKSKKQFVKNFPQWSLKPGLPDLQANALPTELSQHSVASLNLHSLYKVMLYWFQKWTKSNMWSGAWNTKLFLPSSVGKALVWRSRGPGFNLHQGQILTKIFFALPYVKICQMIWQKCLSWKTQICPCQGLDWPSPRARIRLSHVQGQAISAFKFIKLIMNHGKGIPAPPPPHPGGPNSLWDTNGWPSIERLFWYGYKQHAEFWFKGTFITWTVSNLGHRLIPKLLYKRSRKRDWCLSNLKQIF